MSVQSRIQIIHSGNDNEEKYIKHMQHFDPSTSYESINFYTHRNKEYLIHFTLKKCNEQKQPVIVLISQEFLDLIWCTPLKESILVLLTSYSSLILHVWMEGVEELFLKRYSSRLVRQVPGFFSRIKFVELKNQPETKQIDIIHELLLDSQNKTRFKDLCVQLQDAERQAKSTEQKFSETYVEDDIDQLSKESSKMQITVMKGSDRKTALIKDKTEEDVPVPMKNRKVVSSVNKTKLNAHSNSKKKARRKNNNNVNGLYHEVAALV